MKKSFIFLTLLISVFAAAADLSDVQLFPVDFQRGSYPVTEKYPYRITVKFKGETWKLRQNPPKFVIELPAQTALVDSTTRLVPRQKIAWESEKFNRDGKEFVRYTLALPTAKINFAAKSFIWRCGFDIYLEAAGGSAGKSWDVPYYFIVNGEKTLERSFHLSVLPEIPENRKAFQKFRFSIKELPSSADPDGAMLKRNLKMWKSFSANLFMAWGWEQYIYPEVNRKHLNDNVEFFFWTHAGDHSTMILQNSSTDDLGFYVRDRVTRPGVPLYHDASGKINPRAICPQYLMKDPEGLFYGDYLRRAIEKVKKYSPGIKSFIIDYEPIAAGGTCPECLKDFARFAKLKSVPARADIKPGKPLNRSWQLYKIHQNKIIMNKIADGVKKHFPGMKISFCSTELRPSAEVINTWDAVDVGAMESKTDFYSFMIYSTGTTFYNHLSYAAKNLTKAASFPWIDPSEEVERFFLRYTPEKVQQNIIAAIALNSMGLMIYPSDTLDGRYMTMFAKTCDTLAGVEEIYYGKNLSGQVKAKVLNTAKIKLVDAKGNLSIAEYPDLNEQLKVHLHEKNGIYLLSILNYASEKACVEIAIPSYNGGSVTASDLINRRNYTGITAENIRKGFAVEIPADGSAVIKLGGEAGNFPAVQQSAVREAGKTAADSGSAIPTGIVSKGNAAVQWRLFKKNVMITLVHGENYVTINPGMNGRIEEWMIGNNIPTGRPSGNLGELVFYDPAQAEKREYFIEKIDLDGKNPAIILKSPIKADSNAGGAGNPLAGTVLEKRIELTLDGTVIMTDTLINSTDKVINSGFRVKYLPYSVWKAAASPVVTLAGKPLLPDVYLKPGVKLNWYAAANAKELHADAVFSIKTSGNIYNFEYPGAVGVYFWKNQVLHTAEALYPQFTLKPGEKYSVTGKISAGRK